MHRVAHTVFFVGKPGCGKGTQAKRLAEVTGWPMFSSGGLLRALEEEDTPIGRRLKKQLAEGTLSPHWLAMYLYLKSLFSIDTKQSAIFDGFNRKVPEAELIVDSLSWLERSFSIILIKISDEEAHRRIEGRSQGGARSDDHVVAERLAAFYEHTEPAIEIFRDAGVLLEIDGEQSPEAVFAAVKRALALELAPQSA
ncbi:MAG: nucleoside monophosphate kinase [Patescibacteria group bacterium]|nr:nucleoside monophosphate kinase [Patescibacteria group bacterium]MDE1944117.1 nucleoside monophosphate kinase [Patescibacteria group bacterium]MDE1945050.1 nucleoside monophosphate kinase [Patescibacteria group bacterium]MDE2057510.1 nucleoside monophosphate kinase [Patescibacteria group bacterium]